MIHAKRAAPLLLVVAGLVTSGCSSLGAHRSHAPMPPGPSLPPPPPSPASPPFAPADPSLPAPGRSPETLGDRAAAFARAPLGKPYCWGGTGPGCFDCSGLTYAAWRWAGRDIPRSSSAQHDRLARTHMSTLVPGDILWRPGHVGLYVGGGWVVHAPQRGERVEYQPVARYRKALRP